MNDSAGQSLDIMLDDQTEKLSEILVGLVHCCHERVMGEAKRLGLLRSELELLRLFGGEESMTVRGIAGRLDVAKSRVTRVVDGLVTKGLVVRTGDPGDGRSKLIRLTATGRAKNSEINEVFKLHHRELLMPLSLGERRNVITYLEMLRGTMESLKEL